MLASDSTLIDLPKDRDSAFWQLWQQHQDYLYRCCVKWMEGNTAEAEDALSRAMLKAWEKLRNGNHVINNFKAWLTQLTRNLCVDIHRERNRSSRKFESWEEIAPKKEEEFASQEETPVLAATRQELDLFLRNIIDELPDRLRQTFVLHFEADLSYREIGEQLNISYDNVRKRISQAREILRKRLSEDFVGEDETNCDLSEFKSKVSPESPKQRKSKNTARKELVAEENLALSEELEKAETVEDEKTDVSSFEEQNSSCNYTVGTRHHQIMSVIQNFNYAVSLQKCSRWHTSIIILKDPEIRFLRANTFNKEIDSS
ncbi:RNA polymerase sigma factor [Floridanema aerugineum]|uniref:RNA polymerase sigma factor n=1 Tax=Floridaenema aerugineum BLCC-F46 TaxID=3153654 RepID=A0ABV4X0G6_9CYAN